MAKMVAMNSLIHTNTSKSATAYNTQNSVKSSIIVTDAMPTMTVDKVEEANA